MTALHANEARLWSCKNDKLLEDLKATQAALGAVHQTVDRNREIFRDLILNITHGICNMCGEDLAGGDNFILDYCGAVRFIQ
jgi:hypothetical protein